MLLTAGRQPCTWPVDHDRKYHDCTLIWICWEVVCHIQDLKFHLHLYRKGGCPCDEKITSVVKV
jgi:hypothetical protein